MQVTTGSLNPMMDDIVNTTMETERLQLKELTPESLTNVFTTCSDEDITRLLGLQTAEELETEKSNFRLGLISYRSSFKTFLLVEKGSGKTVGRAGFHTWYTQHARAEIGYSITDDAVKRKGYMKEALAAIIDFGFMKMGLNRIEAFAGKENMPSLLLLKGFGFVEEGVLRSHYFKNNKMEDSICFSVLRSEYVKQ